MMAIFSAPEFTHGRRTTRPPANMLGSVRDAGKGGIVASKDKGGKAEKKKPQKALKEKRAAKKAKKK